MNQHYNTSFMVDQSPEEAFAAINNVRGWWSQAIEGDTDKPDAEFKYHYQDVHRATFKITEFVPGKKVVWHVLDNSFNFTQDKNEWIGNDMVFEIAKKGDKTEVHFTQRDDRLPRDQVSAPRLDPMAALKALLQAPKPPDNDR